MNHAVLVSTLFLVGYGAFLLLLYLGMRAAFRGRTEMPEVETDADTRATPVYPHRLSGYTPPCIGPGFIVDFPDEYDEVDDCED